LHYCPNDVAIAVTASGNNLLWYTTLTGGAGTTVAPIPNTAIAPVSFNYFVSQTQQGATLACEGPRAQIVVDVNNNLTVNIGGDTALCEAKSLQFFPAISPTAITYLWRSTNVSSSTIDTLSKKDAIVSPADSAVYILKATLGGCVTEDTVIVNVRLKPILKTISPVIICHFDSTIIKGIITHTSNNLIDYAWTKIDSLTTPNELQTMAHPIITSWYKITATTTSAAYGCDFSISDSVKVIVQPIVNAFAGKDTIAAKDAPHLLRGTGGLYYNWTSSANISSPFSQNTLVNLNSDALFYLEARDAIGCKGYDTIFVKVYDGPTYYIPNSFTPNGDGLNDIFRAIPAGIANTTYFRVFNRNGNLVFETNQWLKGWDGNFNGKPQSNGTYVWMIAGVDKDNKKVEMKGTVNLMR
jgi:gliding motility-associated-like protein